MMHITTLHNIPKRSHATRGSDNSTLSYDNNSIIMIFFSSSSLIIVARAFPPPRLRSFPTIISISLYGGDDDEWPSAQCGPARFIRTTRNNITGRFTTTQQYCIPFVYDLDGFMRRPLAEYSAGHGDHKTSSSSSSQ